MNEKTVRTLELDKILEQLASHTTFSGGAELARELRPSTDLEEAQSWQRETAEARQMLATRGEPSMGGVRDVRDVAIKATRGVLVEQPVMLDIRYTLRRATTLRRTLGRMPGQYPLLAEIINEVEECPELQEEIARVLDDNAEIRDSASPELATIRRDLKVAFDRLQTRLNRIVSSSANSQFLQEALVTMRNGRYVVPIKSEFKGRIPGIVHDSSSSGATLFIEPLETVELNNRWRELQLDEEKEIRRILQALTDFVGEESEKIIRTVEVLSYIDLVFAKARYAEALTAAQPTLVPFKARSGHPEHPGSIIYLKQARHPLLKGNVVPIDIEFGDETWVLVVTGPNTGGKTVSLKTVGLMCLMAQCGLHLPSTDAQLSVFEGIYADIGDEQSIEQSLSTFSSHMTNTITILRECDQRSLVLLDELGAGTDPTEGSALARAILSELLSRKVTTIVTTHHPELKIYSVETPGVRNASVEFDLETLAPTYRLIVGLPGRSNALAIAARLGLNSGIIENARRMVGTEDLVADDLLDEIHRTREDIRRQQLAITAMREEIEEERDALNDRLTKIEEERRELIAATRKEMEAEAEAFQVEIRRLRSEMRTAVAPREKLQEIQEEAEALAASAQKPVRNVVELPDSGEWMPRLGDTVYLETLKAEGVISELEKNAAVVQVGSLRVRAGLNELSRRTRGEKKAANRKERRHGRNSDVAVARPSSPGIELDLRGERVEDALKRLEDYLDAAYLSGLPFSRIIHGKGTGALRQAVQEHVREHPLVASVSRAEASEGGEGVTIVHMVPVT